MPEGLADAPREEDPVERQDGDARKDASGNDPEGRSAGEPEIPPTPGS